MAQCSGKHISAMQLFYELKQGFPHIPDRLVNHCIKQAQGDKEACWCMLMSEQPRMSEPSAGILEIPSAPSGPSVERPRRPPASHTTYMPPSYNPSRPDQPISSLIQRQLERKRNLEVELLNEKRRLIEMKKREEELENEIKARLAANNLSVKARMLSDEIQVLNAMCKNLAMELDDEGDTDWSCHMCTFQNNHLINQCESCFMPQGGETQNIHIHVTHHNFPSCNCFYPDYEENEYEEN